MVNKNKLVIWFGLLVGVVQFSVQAQSVVLNDKCVINILNRTIAVEPDGGWSLPNVPSNMGQIRARATCTLEDGRTVSGQSDYFSITRNANNKIGEITFEQLDPIPQRLVYDSSDTITLTKIDQTQALTVTAFYADNSVKDVSGAWSGVNYSSTNDNVVSVTADGVITAKANGTALISANKDGVLVSRRVAVAVGADLDGDGLPDDFEREIGLNPNDPIDALEDLDNDGLSNLQEYQLGTDLEAADTDGDGISDQEELEVGDDGAITNPLLGDSDGDDIPDGLELLGGTDPNDNNSGTLAQYLESVQVVPPVLSLNYNAIDGEASERLKVRGVLLDGSWLDITSQSKGTTYSTSDVTIANFGLADGEIFAGLSGSAVIQVSNGGKQFEVAVAVSEFTPKALAAISIPGYANNVAVEGDMAYVAAGDQGLQIVNVFDRSAPKIVGALDTNGTAIDVKAVGNRVYLADGSAGLQIIDTFLTATPTLTSTTDTDGFMQDLAIQGDYVFAADGDAGVKIFDVKDPAAVTLVKSMIDVGHAKAVSVEGRHLVVLSSTHLHLFDISNKTAPVLLTSITSSNGKNIDMAQGYVYVAAYSSGYRVYKITLSNTFELTGSGTSFVPRDVVATNGFAFFAEQLFPNVVAFLNTKDPQQPSFQSTIDLAPLGDYAGTGIDLDGSHVYITEQSHVVGSDYGTSGNTKLFIAQYRNSDFVSSSAVVDNDGDGISDSWEYHYFGSTTADLSQDSDNDGIIDGEEGLLNLNPKSADSDSDGLPDGWEMQHELDPLADDAQLDSDGDGATNEEEFYGGTDPKDSADIPVRSRVDFEQQNFGPYYWQTTGTGEWQITDEKAHGGSFSITNNQDKYPANKTSSLETSFVSVGGLLKFAAQVSCYRNDRLLLSINDVEQLISCNNDFSEHRFSVTAGLTTVAWTFISDGSSRNLSEAVWLDDIQFPGLADSDGDEVADGWEYRNFESLNADLSLDSDNDGLSDLQEGLRQLNPHTFDSDSDGLPDMWEVTYGFDPLVDDSQGDADGDGSTNEEEYFGDTDPQDNSSIPVKSLVDFEDQTMGDYHWVQGGEGTWEVVNDKVNSGAYALRNNQDAYPAGKTSTLETTVLANAGMLRFAAALKCSYSDKLTFSLNGVDHNVPCYASYKKFSYPVTAGKLALKWTFVTDGSSRDLSEATWLDDIQLPGIADSDADGVADGWEYRYFDAIDTDLSLDSDGDGLTDLQEGQHELDPLVTDTDGDGLNDGWEVNNGLDAHIDDSQGDADGDGTTNEEEYFGDTDPQDNSSIPVKSLVDFEDQTMGDYHWVQGGEGTWAVVNDKVNSGAYALRNNQDAYPAGKTSTLETTVLANAGMLRFAAALKCSYSDKLTFSLNGVDHNVPCYASYKKFSYPVTAGKLALKWTFVTDGSSRDLSEATWLDDIQLPGVADSDADGVADGWEYRYFDALDSDLSLDSDDDGSTDLQEYQAKTDPLDVYSQP